MSTKHAPIRGKLTRKDNAAFQELDDELLYRIECVKMVLMHTEDANARDRLNRDIQEIERQRRSLRDASIQRQRGAIERERELKREAQRIIAEGLELIFRRMVNQCTPTELQLVQDMAATGGSLRAIGKLRRDRGEKKAKCHPEAVRRDMERFQTKHREIYEALKETKRARKRALAVADVDTLRINPSAIHGDAYRRAEVDSIGADAAVELKDILADHVEPGELERVCADVLAWHKREV